MKKRIQALVLLVALLTSSSVLLACGNDTPGTNDATTTAPGNTAVTTAPVDTTPAETELSDELDEYNFNGKVLHVLGASSTSYKGYLDVAELNGDVLNDAIYSVNRTVEARFNMKIEETIYPAGEANTVGSNLLQTNEHVYEIMSKTAGYGDVSKGYFLSYESLPNVNLDKPYWNQSLNESISIGGKQYLAFGDFNLTTMDYTYALAFNAQLIKDLGLDNPYELVDSGKWTFDKFNEMATAAVSDIDGNTTMDKNDRYGWSSVRHELAPSMWVAANVMSIQKNEDDMPYFAMPGNEKFYDVYTKILDIAYKNGTWYDNNDWRDTIITDTMFQEGRALFQTTSFSQLGDAYYRTMTDSYGVIPHPKWDESQEKYYTRVEGARMYGIPFTLPEEDMEFVGTCLEALAYQAHMKTIPAYYEISLKVKYSTDSDMSRMFDIIMENRVFDLGDTIWTGLIRNGFMHQLIKDRSYDIISAIDANRIAIEENIQKTVDDLIKNNP